MRMVVNIDVSNIEDAARFYTGALDLRVGRQFRDSAIELLGAEAPIFLLANPPGSDPFAGAKQARSYDRHWTPVHLDFVVEQLEAWTARATVHGAGMQGAIQVHPWGRMALMSDPFGNGFCLLELTERGYDVDEL